MKWYCVQHKKQTTDVYQEWVAWFYSHVGTSGDTWKWASEHDALQICFANEEDATAFKLRFIV